MKLKNFNKNTHVKEIYIKYRFKYLIKYFNKQLTFTYHKNDYVLITHIQELPYNLYFKNLKVGVYPSFSFLTKNSTICFDLYLK